MNLSRDPRGTDSKWVVPRGVAGCGMADIAGKCVGQAGRYFPRSLTRGFVSAVSVDAAFIHLSISRSHTPRS